MIKNVINSFQIKWKLIGLTRSHSPFHCVSNRRKCSSKRCSVAGRIRRKWLNRLVTERCSSSFSSLSVIYGIEKLQKSMIHPQSSTFRLLCSIIESIVAVIEALCLALTAFPQLLTRHQNRCLIFFK